jgi:hypothetical protein
MPTIFVFGSNREGRHGKGAALTARQQYGAIYGQARGRQGNAYAIVTKELRRGVNPVTLDQVKREVDDFIKYATDNPADTFIVTRIGCGLAGFTDDQIAPLFSYAPDNCTMPAGW